MPVKPSDDKTAASSTAEAGATGESPTPKADEKTLSEVVAEAAAKHTTTPSSGEPGEQTEQVPGEEEQTTEQAPAEETEQQEEEVKEEAPATEVETEAKDKNLPFNNHPRWKEVIQERNQARAEIEDLKPRAEFGEALSSYCRDNDISQEDLQTALELAALSKRDVKAFRSRLQEYADGIDYSTGERLPADIQKKVDEGHLDLESAKELAQLRESKKHGSAQVRKTQEQLQREHTSSVSNALNSWEMSMKKTDPDWDTRRQLLTDRLSSLWRTNPPQSVADAIALAEQANKFVKEQVAKFRPKPRQRKTLTTTGSSPNPGEKFEMKSLQADLPRLVNMIAAQHRG